MGKTTSRVTQLDEGGEQYGQAPGPPPATAVGYAGAPTADEFGLGEEVIDEVAGAGEAGEAYREDVEAMEVDETDAHAPVSSPPVAPGAPSGAGMGVEAAAAADTESMFESVEGWSESLLTEAAAEEAAEPSVEAYFADEASQEFLPALGAILAPLAKTVLPALASAVIQKGVPQLSPRIQELLRRLSAMGIRVQVRTGRETGETPEAAAAEEAALEQALESLEVVLGNDDRVQVSNATVVPWKRICHLRIEAANGKLYLGTGSFLGPRTIVTAGHCVYIHGQGGWARKITVTPGRNGSSEPYGKYEATSFRSVKGWTRDTSRNHDYGAIILPRSTAISQQIGSFGVAHYPDQYLQNRRLNTAGYPGDKPAGTMWFHGRIAKAVGERTLTYDIDTAGGQSGSPVWIFDGTTGKRIVVGIHTNGSPSGNSATRITKPVFDNLQRWRSEGGLDMVSAYRTRYATPTAMRRGGKAGAPTGQTAT
jgi:V8-like Glu-specific endopeptidase